MVKVWEVVGALAAVAGVGAVIYFSTQGSTDNSNAVQNPNTSIAGAIIPIGQGTPPYVSQNSLEDPIVNSLNALEQQIAGIQQQIAGTSGLTGTSATQYTSQTAPIINPTTVPTVQGGVLTGTGGTTGGVDTQSGVQTGAGFSASAAQAAGYTVGQLPGTGAPYLTTTTSTSTTSVPTTTTTVKPTNSVPSSGAGTNVVNQIISNAQQTVNNEVSAVNSAVSSVTASVSSGISNAEKSVSSFLGGFHL
jgi:hypothetical protein